MYFLTYVYTLKLKFVLIYETFFLHLSTYTITHTNGLRMNFFYTIHKNDNFNQIQKTESQYIHYLLNVFLVLFNLHLIKYYNL